MKMSDNFGSMDDVRVYAEQFKPYATKEQYHALLTLLGLAEQEGVFEIVIIDEKEIKIDRFLAPMIKDLNERGIKTLACCSNLKSEHKCQREKGYISVAFDKSLFEIMKLEIVDPDISVKESECYLQKAITIYINQKNEKILKEKWAYLRDCFETKNYHQNNDHIFI